MNNYFQPPSLLTHLEIHILAGLGQPRLVESYIKGLHQGCLAIYMGYVTWIRHV